jgi:hypothetical protein
MQGRELKANLSWARAHQNSCPLTAASSRKSDLIHDLAHLAPLTMAFAPGRPFSSYTVGRVTTSTLRRLAVRLTRPSYPCAPALSRPFSSTLARTDIEHFLRSYPRFRADPTKNANLDFYKGKGKARPDSATIDELLSRLESDWEEVESNVSLSRTSSYALRGTHRCIRVKAS